MRSVRVIALILGLSVAPAAEAGPLVFGQEHDTRTPVRGGNRTPPRLAAGQGAALATWIHMRSEVPIPFFTRIEASGAVGAPAGVRLPGRASGTYDTPIDVASDGSRYLVAYPVMEGGVVAVRIAADGTPLDATPIIVATAGWGPARVASDGDGWLVAWRDGDGDGRVVARRVSAAGEPLGGELELAAPAPSAGCLEVAFGAGRWLVIWTDERDGTERTYGARIDPDGTLLDPGGRLLLDNVPGAFCGHDVAGSAGGYGYAAETPRGGVAVIAWAGDLTERARTGVDGSTVMYNWPTVASEADGYFITWQAQSLREDWLVAMRLGEDGATVQVGTFPFEPALAHATAIVGSDVIVAWKDVGNQLHARPFSTLDLVPGADVPLWEAVEPQADEPQAEPAVAVSGARSLVAWSGPLGVRALRLDGDGAPLDPEPLSLFTGPSRLPVAAATEGGFVVAYSAGGCVDGDPCGARVSFVGLDGTVGESVVAIEDPVEDVAPGVTLASDGTTALVGALRRDHGPIAALVRPDGTAAPVALAPSAGDGAPRAVHDGAGYALVWASGGEVALAEVAADGTATPHRVLEGTPCGNELRAAVAGGGAIAVVCGGSTLEASVFARDGEVRAGGLEVARGVDGAPPIGSAFDGKHLLFAWEPEADGALAGATAITRLTAGGALADVAPLVAPATPTAAHAPALAAAPHGRGFLAYARLDESDLVSRVFVRPFRRACLSATPGTACDDGDPCTTGDVCAAGTCAGDPDPACAPPDPEPPPGTEPEAPPGGDGGKSGSDSGCGCGPADTGAGCGPATAALALLLLARGVLRLKACPSIGPRMRGTD